MLENENVRAVGNMGVNARGDVLDGSNRVIDPKNRQVQRQYQRQTLTNAATGDLESSLVTNTRSAKQLKAQQEASTEEVEEIVEDDTTVDDTVVIEETSDDTPAPRGGLAAAIAKSQAVKQELLKTPRQLAQEQRTGIKKI